MEPFKSCRGVVATLNRANVDTDQIIPKQYLKSIRRTGFEVGLFADWRSLPDGSPDPEFVLNQPRFASACVLVTRHNFGCGSSREHAVWAVMQGGFRAVIAPRREQDGKEIPAFADIFHNNAVKNGLLCVELAEDAVDEILALVERYSGLEATVDLERQEVLLHAEEDVSFHFDIGEAEKNYLLRGRDDIALTLEYEADIARYEEGKWPSHESADSR